MSKRLVVLGATGFQGGAVIECSSRAARQPAASGVEVVRADLNDVGSLRAAFNGANCIFALTDFGGLVQEVVPKLQAGEVQLPIGAVTKKMEVQQGRNIGDAAADVPELERLIWSFSADATHLSKGKYAHVYHFDAKAAVTEYVLSKKQLQGKVSCVLMGIIQTNLLRLPHASGIKMQDDGTAVITSFMSTDTVLPWIDVEADSGSFVHALVKAPAPLHVMGVSDFLSIKQWLEIWSKQMGVPARYEMSTSFNDDADSDPIGLSLHMLETKNFVADFGDTLGDPDVIMPEELAKEGFPVQQTQDRGLHRARRLVQRAERIVQNMQHVTALRIRRCHYLDCCNAP